MVDPHTEAPAPDDLAERVRALVREVPDFPLPGVLFPRHHAAARGRSHRSPALVESWAQAHACVDVVAGVEARGFIFAAPLAVRLGAGFVPVRKSGKLPGATEQASYALEYGTATLEVTRDAFRSGQRVLLVDDVLATGGTAAAASVADRAHGGRGDGRAGAGRAGGASAGRDRLAGKGNARATFAV